jgi:alkaline phosphatase
MGISDALSARANVSWLLPSGMPAIAPDEGDHTVTKVPVFAFGPGSEEIEDGIIDNTEIGQLLLESVDGI